MLQILTPINYVIGTGTDAGGDCLTILDPNKSVLRKN